MWVSKLKVIRINIWKVLIQISICGINVNINYYRHDFNNFQWIDDYEQNVICTDTFDLRNTNIKSEEREDQKLSTEKKNDIFMLICLFLNIRLFAQTIGVMIHVILFRENTYTQHTLLVYTKLQKQERIQKKYYSK